MPRPCLMVKAYYRSSECCDKESRDCTHDCMRCIFYAKI